MEGFFQKVPMPLIVTFIDNQRHWKNDGLAVEVSFVKSSTKCFDDTNEEFETRTEGSGLSSLPHVLGTCFRESGKMGMVSVLVRAARTVSPRHREWTNLENKLT